MSDTTLLFLALALAHLVADFPLQTDWMVANKRQWRAMGAHIGVVAITTSIALGGAHWAVWAAIVISHFVIDWIKTRYAGQGLISFVIDQIAHLGILGIAAWWITRTQSTLWITADHAQTMSIAAGLIIATYVGAPIISALMRGLSHDPPDDGIKGAGRIIGLLERGLIFGLVLIGEPGAVGFLIAAKSVLRFDTVKKSQAISEYVIIGTLASFAWAFAIAYAVTR